MSKFYKALAGPHFETLSKALYRKELGRIVDPADLYWPLLALPRSLLSWLIANIKPMPTEETKEFIVPGTDAKLSIRKLISDQYVGEIQRGGRIIYKFEPTTLPALGGHLLSVLELYEEVAGRPVEEIEKKELAEKAEDKGLAPLVDKLSELIDKIVASQAMKKDELPATAAAVPPPAPPAAPQQPVVVNISLSGIGNIATPSVTAEPNIPVKPKEDPKASEEMKKDELKAPPKPNLPKAEIDAKDAVAPSIDQLAPQAPGQPKKYAGSARERARQIVAALKAKKPLDKDDGYAIAASPPVKVEESPEHSMISGQSKVFDSPEQHKEKARIYFKNLLGRLKMESATQPEEKPTRQGALALKNRLEKKSMGSMKAPEAGQKSVNMAPQAPAPMAAPNKGIKTPALAGPPKPDAGGGMPAPKTPGNMPSIAKLPSMKPNTPAKMKMPGIQKDELETAKSDTGRPLFTKEGENYVFVPTGVNAVMTKGSVEIKKSEDGTFTAVLDPTEWDRDRLELFHMMIKAKGALKKYGF